MSVATAPTDIAPTGAEPSANPHHARRWTILLVLALAQLMVVLDTTVVNIALPSAQTDLGFGNDGRQWIVTAYALAFGSLLLLGGRLSDMVGRKRMFLIGLGGFAVASAVGGAATDFAMLVIARAVQGGFGAVLAPAALSLLTTTFTDPKERSKAFAIYGSMSGGGGALGLLVGGSLTEYLSWRWCMYVNLVFAAVGLVGGLLLLRRERIENTSRLDVLGVVLVVGGLFGLVYGFAHAETAGWMDATTMGFIAAGIVLLGVFITVEARSGHPLLPLRVLADRNRGGSLLAIFIVGAAMFGLFLFLTYYLQTTLGYSAVLTGVAFLPMIGALVLAATTSSALLANRVGPRWLVGGGMLVAAAGMALLTGIGLSSSYTAQILPGLLVAGAGIGLVFSSVLSLATLGVRVEDAGVGSATTTVGQQIGGSLGTALLNTLFASALTGYLTSHAPSPDVAGAAALHGYAVVFWICAGLFAGGSVVCGSLLRSAVPQLDPDADELPSL